MVAKKALVIVDMQNDFCRKEGALFVPNNPKIIPRIEELVGKCRRKGWKIVYTQDWHRKDDPEFKLWPRHCVAGTWGAEIVEELKPERGDIVVKKTSYSAFDGTNLDRKLKKLGVDTLMLCGCVTNFCVLFTAYDAFRKGYRVWLKEDCLGYVSKRDHEFAIRLMRLAFKAKVL